LVATVSSASEGVATNTWKVGHSRCSSLSASKQSLAPSAVEQGMLQSIGGLRMMTALMVRRRRRLSIEDC